MLRSGGDLVTDVQAVGRLYRYLADGLRVRLGSASYSATTIWVIYELARQDVTEVTELRRRTGIDPGYLSRLLARFQANELITRHRSPADARCQVVRLTVRGRAVCEAVDGRAEEAVRRRLTRFTDHDRLRIAEAMAAIRGAVDNVEGGRRAL